MISSTYATTLPKEEHDPNISFHYCLIGSGRPCPRRKSGTFPLRRRPGKPLTVPECPRVANRYDYKASFEGLCAKRVDAEKQGWGTLQIPVFFNAKDRPAYVRKDFNHGDIKVELSGDIVIYISVGVNQNTQDYIPSLEKKFGPLEKGNFGWEFPDYKVGYFGNTVTVQKYEREEAWRKWQQELLHRPGMKM